MNFSIPLPISHRRFRLFFKNHKRIKMKTENETKGVIKYSVESVKDGKTTNREEIIFNCLPSFISQIFCRPAGEG